MTSVGVIAHARKVLGGGLPELRESLRRHGVDDPLWRQVPKSKFAPKLVGELIDEGVDLLFVWGGDGMVQRCIDAVRKAPVTLAILPAGTANLFASNMGIPKDLEAAVDVGLHGARRTIDVGSVNGERFAVMAGSGFDAAMIRGAGGSMKKKLGRLSYVVTGMRAVRRDAIETRIEVDGLPWFKGASTCVLVGNMGDVFGGISAFPHARPDDGRLDVAVVTAESLLQWARTLGRTAAGNPAASPFVQTSTAEKIDVRLEKKAPYELDGGDRPKTKRLKIRTKPAAITVCVPERKDER